MIYRDEHNLYVMIPKMHAAMLTKSIIQALLSMKIDQASLDTALSSSEFTLIQFANMINNAQAFETDEQLNQAQSIFLKGAINPSDQAESHG